MDESVSISQVADRDAPALMMTEKLVICLRACTLFATTPQASRVRLTASGAGFASELTLVANRGLDTLVDTHKYFNVLKLTADSLARPGGTLDGLQSTIGVPSQRNSHQRLMRRLESDLETCKTGGIALEKKLAGWRAEVEQFQAVLTRSNEIYVSQSDEKDAEIARYDAEIKSATALLRQGEEEGAEAEFKYDQSQKHQKSLITELVLPATLRGATILELAYTAVRIGFSWYTSGIAAQDVKKTQEELERRRRNAEEYKLQIAEAEVELQKLTGQSKQLNDFTKALTPTLRALVSLTDNLRALVLGFSAMEPLLKMLVGRQAETAQISDDVQSEPASLSDIRDFMENTTAMGTLALKIEHLAWLYGSVIENVLIGGLGSVQSAASDHPTTHVETLDFFHTAQRQQLYLQGGNSTCTVIKSEVGNQVDAKYEQKRIAMERRHEVERRRLAKEEEQAKKLAKKQADKEARSGRLRLFSRSKS